MDQMKIGKFIAACRKENSLTQVQLAEKLNITDRAVSKWETGKTMPDSALMLDLCDILKISVNDLLNGEKISSEDYHKKAEAQMLEVVKAKEQSDKLVLRLTLLIDVLILLAYVSVVIIAIHHDIFWLTMVLYSVWAVLHIFSVFLLTRVLQKTGYYQCSCCRHIYIPTYKTVFFSSLGKKLYTCCPECKKRTWHKKVFTKE